jgi:hypothetical protein
MTMRMPLPSHGACYHGKTMDIAIDLKLVATILSMALGALAFLPYLLSIKKDTTRPHPYTWLILTLTQATATAGLFAGHAGLISYGFLTGTLMTGIIFLLSLRHIKESVAKGDNIILAAALIAMLMWWIFDHHRVAIFMVSVIDFIAYIPTMRKVWRDPRSESGVAWALFALSFLFALLALESYNMLTVPYLIAVLLADTIIATLVFARRTPTPLPTY